MPPKVLIIDGHYIIRLGIRNIFESYFGCNVEEATSKKELMEYLYMQKNYDIIFLDINLPDSRNFSIISQIKILLPTAKICVFTILSTRIYTEKIIALGAVCFIYKSEDKDSIIKKIKDVITYKPIKI